MRRTPFSWRAIGQYLLRSTSTPSFRRDFGLIRDRHSHIFCFENPLSLLDTLHGLSDAPEGKNQVLTSLVSAAQSDEPEADCALTLMVLALWPGLESLFGRAKRRGLGTVDELTSGILGRAVEAVRCLDLHRVRTLAATVLRNIERDLIRECRKEAENQSNFLNADPDEFGLSRQTLSCAWLRHELDRCVGKDADLVFEVAVEGRSQSEAAVRFGLSEAATRKRYQRAKRRLRRVLEFA